MPLAAARGTGCGAFPLKTETTAGLVDLASNDIRFCEDRECVGIQDVLCGVGPVHILA